VFPAGFSFLCVLNSCAGGTATFKPETLFPEQNHSSSTHFEIHITQKEKQKENAEEKQY
jgi:hypothetical protein